MCVCVCVCHRIFKKRVVVREDFNDSAHTHTHTHTFLRLHIDIQRDFKYRIMSSNTVKELNSAMGWDEILNID